MGQDRRALVTGAAGFVGRHLVERLLERGFRVRALLRPASDRAHLERLGVELAPGDLADPESLRRAAARVDVLVHAAAQVGAWGARGEFHRCNVVGTRNVVEAALAAGVGKLVHLSSVSVYGRRQGVVTEACPRLAIGDPYGDTKLAAEVLVQEAERRHRLPVTILRPCVVYGRHDRQFLPVVARNLQAGTMVVVGSGENRAALVHVADLAALTVLAAERDEAAGEVFNVAGAETPTWNQLLAALARELGAQPPRRHVPYAAAYAAGWCLEALWKLAGARAAPRLTRFAARLLGQDYVYDSSKAERVLGFRPRVTLEAGLRDAVAWLRSGNGEEGPRGPSSSARPENG